MTQTYCCYIQVKFYQELSNLLTSIYQVIQLTAITPVFTST